jgi:hypothetical protein
MKTPILIFSIRSFFAGNKYAIKLKYAFRNPFVRHEVEKIDGLVFFDYFRPQIAKHQN